MAIEDRRARERAAQRELITTTARRLAEQEGWDAVTTRRLSTEIEYSQPVLYKHFSSMEGVVASVAVQGFDELADALSAARSGATDGRDALARVAHAFIGFAHHNPALFDAMFTRATTLRFADPETPAELNAAFAELRAAGLFKVLQPRRCGGFEMSLHTHIAMRIAGSSARFRR